MAFWIIIDTEPYAAVIFKVLFLPQFFLGVYPNFMTTLVAMVNLYACQKTAGLENLIGI